MLKLAPVIHAVKGLAPTMAVLVKGTYDASDQRQTLKHSRGTASRLTTRGLHAGLVPFHSQLLGESNFLSFPPLNNMLKFGGLPYLI